MFRTLASFLAILLLGLAVTPASGAERTPVLLISGANNHDWEWTHKALRDMLVASGKFDVTITLEPGKTLADREGMQRYRAFVLDYNGPRWGEAAEKVFLERVRAGTGVAIIHAANNAFPGWVEYETLCGLCWRKGTGHGRFHRFDVKITDRDHPVTRGLPDLKAHPDELYHRLVHMHEAKFRILGTAFSSKESGGTGRDEPMITVSNFGKGRIFHTPLGHVWRNNIPSRDSFKDPQFQNLVIRGTEWAATGDVTDVRGTQSTSGGEWRSLFDGRTTAGWRGFKKPGFPEKGWRIEDGAMQVLAKGGGGDIITEEQFDDFELRLEWKVAPGANSGIIYLVSEEEGATWRTGPEFQILDDGDKEPTSNITSGAMYALYSAHHKVLKPVGEYNAARVLVCGDHVEHWVNGTKVLEARLDSDDWKKRVAASKFGKMPRFGTVRRGHIALQDHGNDVWFRNIQIREIPAREKARYAGEEKPIFNGRDLEGWTYFLNGDAKASDVWRIEDGTIICSGRPAGFIRTQAAYESFILKLDWRWPAGKKPGNSGVLFRVGGEDKVWPRCLEAQLMHKRAGDFWRIGDYPMDTDPSRTKGRNARHTRDVEKPVGEWNEYEIIVDGGDVRLIVNGQVVNEGTNAQIAPGTIALQSEGAEIHFRNIRLRPIAD